MQIPNCLRETQSQKLLTLAKQHSMLSIWERELLRLFQSGEEAGLDFKNLEIIKSAGLAALDKCRGKMVRPKTAKVLMPVEAVSGAGKSVLSPGLYSIDECEGVLFFDGKTSCHCIEIDRVKQLELEGKVVLK